ncbi:MAG: RNA methyltransferase [Actinomycetia bacterium]|nr:RNA methyltransferase [Actinomycetes bacterium]
MSRPGRRRDIISSPTNRRVKALVRLRNRRERDRESLFVVEGCREVRRALAWRSQMLEVYRCPSLLPPEGDQKLLAGLGGAVEIVELSEPVFRKASYRERPDGLLAVLRQPLLHLSSLRLGSTPLVLVVEAVEKPGNLGAMLRTAESAGVEAVVVADPITDVFNPNVVRASLGSLFTLPLAVAPGPQVLEWLRRQGMTVIATSPAAERLSWDVDLQGRAAVVIGSEHRGLSDLWLSGADRQVRIPMSGTVDSLNANTAAAVVLFEARRQRSNG